jgi:hypothetical protein
VPYKTHFQLNASLLGFLRNVGKDMEVGSWERKEQYVKKGRRIKSIERKSSEAVSASCHSPPVQSLSLICLFSFFKKRRAAALLQISARVYTASLSTLFLRRKKKGVEPKTNMIDGNSEMNKRKM